MAKRELWTRERIKTVMQLCSSGHDFKKRYNGAFKAMKRNGWTDLRIYLPRNYKPQLSWTRERISELLQELKSIDQFRLQYPYGYQVIRQKNWTDLLEPYMAPEEPIWSVYRWEFFVPSAIYIGLTSNYRRRIATELRNAQTSPIYNFIQSNPGCTYNITELHRRLYSDEAIDLEKAFIEKYNNEGYNVLNRNRGGSLGGYRPVYGNIRPNPYENYTDADLINGLTTSYATYRSIQNDNPELYNELRKRKLLRDAMKLYPRDYTSIYKYSKETILDLVSQCTSKQQFRKNYKNAYEAIKKRSWHELLDSLPDDRPQRIIDKVNQLQLNEYIAKINSGEMTSTEVSAELGISVVSFYNLCKGKLKRGRHRGKSRHHGKSRNKKVRPIPDGFTEALSSVIDGRIKQIDVLRTYGINNAQFRQYAERINPTWKSDQLAKQNQAIIDTALQYETMNDLQKQDINLYSQVKRHKLYHTVASQMKRTKRLPISQDEVKSAASKCTTLAQFMKEYPSEYQVVRNNHWEHLTDHLARTNKSADEFTYEHIWDCAHSCSSRTEFNKKYRSESYAAKKRGIYDEIVADIPKHTWRPQHHTPKPEYIKIQRHDPLHPFPTWPK